MTGLLLNLNFAATAASLLILIVKYILRKKTTPRWQLLIWAVLAVQLIVFPFAEKLPESGVPTVQLHHRPQHPGQRPVNFLADEAGIVDRFHSFPLFGLGVGFFQDGFKIMSFQLF